MTVRAGRAAHHFGEDAMELCITAKSCFKGGIEHGSPLARSVDGEEALKALAIAELDHSESGLLVEEAAEARWA